MKLTEQLILVADAFCAASGLSESRVSTLIFNHGKRLALIRGGSALYTTGFEQAMQWFSDNWPEDEAECTWPREIARPAKAKAGAEA